MAPIFIALIVISGFIVVTYLCATIYVFATNCL